MENRLPSVYDYNMLIDDVTIRVRAGKGGDGVIAFNKNMMSLGPTGGSGGNGGGVYFEGSPDIGALRAFRTKKELAAQDGKDGRGQFRDGERGKDLVVRIPIGTVIHNLDSGETTEVTAIGELLCAAHGGRGGRGNFHFRSSKNTTPKIFEPGKPGHLATIRLELKLIADVGLIGLPNAGKSSLLNMLTKASAKVANYPFTTLEPNLGVWNELVLADIPGLIEGASNGRGLGIRFLRHIERTSVFFHLISAESEEPLKDYETVRKELEYYNKDLLLKKEYVFLSKSDIVGKAELDTKLSDIRKSIPSVLPLSVIDDKTLEPLTKLLSKIVIEKRTLKTETPKNESTYSDLSV